MLGAPDAMVITVIGRIDIHMHGVHIPVFKGRLYMIQVVYEFQSGKLGNHI
jgi:hypothetical protein